MFRRWCGIVLLASLVISKALEAAQLHQDASPRINLLVCDKVGLASDTLRKAKIGLQRIFMNAGVDLTWVHSEGNRAPMTFLPRSWEGCEAPSVVSDFFAVISNGSPAGLPRETMGFSTPGASPPYRLYVLYDRVNTVVSRIGGSDTGTLLAHVLAHELGHVLLRSKDHSPGGIMSGQWLYPQLVEASQGALRFDPAHSHRIRAQLRSNAQAQATTTVATSMLDSAH
jgi:hypothetical protein